MGLEREFLEIMTDSFTLERFTIEDRFGNNTYDAPVTGLPCYRDTYDVNRGEGERQSRLDVVPIKETTMYTDYISPEPAVLDRVTFGDGTVMYITEVTVVRDERTSPHHLVIKARTTDRI